MLSRALVSSLIAKPWFLYPCELSELCTSPTLACFPTSLIARAKLANSVALLSLASLKSNFLFASHAGSFLFRSYSRTSANAALHCSRIFMLFSFPTNVIILATNAAGVPSDTGSYLLTSSVRAHTATTVYGSARRGTYFRSQVTSDAGGEVFHRSLFFPPFTLSLTSAHFGLRSKQCSFRPSPENPEERWVLPSSPLLTAQGTIGWR